MGTNKKDKSGPFPVDPEAVSTRVLYGNARKVQLAEPTQRDASSDALTTGAMYPFG